MTDAIEEFGPYVVYERLGQGGMATVHRAEKRGVSVRRMVALKRLLPHVAADPELVKLFVDEARLASQMNHANVPQTYELGRVGDIYFIAMEYASGPTLAQVARQSQTAGAELPLPLTINVLAQVCAALDYAHNLCDENGVPLRLVHRDVSPANIIVANTGLVKLIDFGIAKATNSSVKTQTGFIKGKFGYIAPEYITGKLDLRADLFAVGVIAHEMLTGQRLFEGKDDFETMANIREMEVTPPSQINRSVPLELDAIVMTALARDPDKRWQTAAALQTALADAAHRLGASTGGPEIVEWIEWVFKQPAREGWGVRADTSGDETNAVGRDARAARVSGERPRAKVITPAPTTEPFGPLATVTDADETRDQLAMMAELERHDSLTPIAAVPVAVMEAARPPHMSPARGVPAVGTPAGAASAPSGPVAAAAVAPGPTPGWKPIPPGAPVPIPAWALPPEDAAAAAAAVAAAAQPQLPHAQHLPQPHGQPMHTQPHGHLQPMHTQPHAAHMQPMHTQPHAAHPMHMHPHDLSGAHAQHGQDVSAAHLQAMHGHDLSGGHMQPMHAQELSGGHMQPMHTQELSGGHMQPMHTQELSGGHMQPMHTQQHAVGKRPRPALPFANSPRPTPQQARPVENVAGVRQTNAPTLMQPVPAAVPQGQGQSGSGRHPQSVPPQISQAMPAVPSQPHPQQHSQQHAAVPPAPPQAKTQLQQVVQIQPPRLSSQHPAPVSRPPSPSGIRARTESAAPPPPPPPVPGSGPRDIVIPDDAPTLIGASGIDPALLDASGPHPAPVAPQPSGPAAIQAVDPTTQPMVPASAPPLLQPVISPPVPPSGPAAVQPEPGAEVDDVFAQLDKPVRKLKSRSRAKRDGNASDPSGAHGALARSGQHPGADPHAGHAGQAEGEPQRRRHDPLLLWLLLILVLGAGVIAAAYYWAEM